MKRHTPLAGSLAGPPGGLPGRPSGGPSGGPLGSFPLAHPMETPRQTLWHTPGRRPRQTAQGDPTGRRPRQTAQGDPTGRRPRETPLADGPGRPPRQTAQGDPLGRRPSRQPLGKQSLCMVYNSFIEMSLISRFLYMDDCVVGSEASLKRRRQGANRGFAPCGISSSNFFYMGLRPLWNILFQLFYRGRSPFAP